LKWRNQVWENKFESVVEDLAVQLVIKFEQSNWTTSIYFKWVSLWFPYCEETIVEG
jgi:hypothetical protein